MKAKLVGQSFERGLDPQKAMGIGGLKNRVEYAVKHYPVDEETIEKFVQKTAQEMGGAFDIYLPSEEQKKLYWICRLVGSKNVKVVHTNGRRPEMYSNEPEYSYDRRIRPLLDRGWEIFWEEDNLDVVEYILVKYV